jgi:hypothetical protein
MKSRKRASETAKFATMAGRAQQRTTKDVRGIDDVLLWVV